MRTLLGPRNFDSTAGAGGFTAGAAAPAVNMLEEALFGSGLIQVKFRVKCGHLTRIYSISLIKVHHDCSQTVLSAAEKEHFLACIALIVGFLPSPYISRTRNRRLDRYLLRDRAKAIRVRTL